MLKSAAQSAHLQRLLIAKAASTSCPDSLLNRHTSKTELTMHQKTEKLNNRCKTAAISAPAVAP
jgi:hypothetical protein